jgi:PilZ domain-containing protein
MTLRNINLERREKLRQLPDQFAFLQLEGDDGGTILDISEGGLRFESFAAVRQNGPMHFWFSLNLRERIEAWGELAWIDAARKSGGLRFLRLSDEARAQIQQCISQASQQEIPATASPRETGAVSTIVSRTQPRQTTNFSGTRESGHSSIPFPAHGEPATSGMLVPMQRHLAAMKRQLIIGLLIGACAGGIVAFAASKFSQYLRENRGEAKPTVELPAQTAPRAGSMAVPPSALSGTPKDVFAIGNQRKGAVGTRVPADPPAEVVGHTGKQKTPLTPDQLWAMVQAGNSTAAAALAELYIKGEGVPQSCAQARVLLLVASEKRNASAIKRLADLDKAGCPAN